VNNAVATWWSYYEADTTILGAAVAILGLAAISLVVSRVLARRRR
jgi:hypothetical protein